MSPHILGWKHGEAHVFSYQFGGRSRHRLEPDGSPRNFRCMRVGLLYLLALVPGEWHTAKGGPEERGNCIDTVDISVDSAEAA